MRRAGIILRAIVLCAILGATPVVAGFVEDAEQATTLDECSALLLDHAGELEPYICLWRVAAQTGEKDDAARRLETRLTIEPDNPRALLYLTMLRGGSQAIDVEAMTRRAVEGFVKENQPRGEVYARLSLSTQARQHERLDEALEQLELAERAAERHGDPHVLADVRVQRAWEVMKEIGDVSHNFEAAEGTN